MKRLWTFLLVSLLATLVGACTAPPAPDPAPTLTPQVRPTSTAGLPARQRIKTIQNYMVYYGSGRIEDLAHYGLAIVQPDSLNEAEVAELTARGTLVVAYLSVGEVEPNREWYIDGRADPRWILGKNENWESYYIDAGQAGWQNLMANLTGQFIQKGYQGVFLDTVDTVDAYPQTRAGMIALIHGLRQKYPQTLLVQNRGMSVADEVAADLDALMFEDVSTTYDFEKKEYHSKENLDEIQNMQGFKKRSGLPILGLDYAPVDNPGMAYRALTKSQANGFIPCVSTINLDEIPDYGLDKPKQPDLRVSSIRAEGEEGQVSVAARVENVGLERVVDAPLTMQIAGQSKGSQKVSLEPGDYYEWSVLWAEPQENQTIQVSADLKSDPNPQNNQLTWVFTYAALAMEPLLPLDQQKQRSAANGPVMTASLFKQGVSIDGDLKEWANLPCTDVASKEQISHGKAGDWQGAQDLSGRVCYGWDPNNLYIAFSVQDDHIVQKYTGGNLWKGDHVEIWVDTQLQLDFDSTSNSADDFQLGLSPGNFADVPPDFFIFTPDQPREAYDSLVSWKVVKTPTGYAGEVRLPKKVLKGLRPAAGQTIGVTFEPSDTDTPGGSEQELMLSSAPQSAANWGNPSYWNNLRFIE